MDHNNTFPGLTNHFLIAMPDLRDPNFNRTVTLICQHDENGALGVVINRPLAHLTLRSGQIAQYGARQSFSPSDSGGGDRGTRAHRLSALYQPQPPLRAPYGTGARNASRRPGRLY